MSYLEEIRDYYPEYADLDDWTLTERIYGSIPELQDFGMSLDSLGKTLGAKGDKYDRLQDRGLVNELFSEVARGVRRGISTGLKASRAFLPESVLGIPTQPTREFITDVDEEFTDPDYEYRKGQLSERPGFYKKYIAGGLETAVHSVAAGLPGAIAGGIAGSAVPGVGTVLGVASGAGLIGGGQFGLAEHYDFLTEAHGLLDDSYTDKYISQGYGKEEARKLAEDEIESLASLDAIKSGLAEFGGEGVSNFLGIGLLKGAGKFIKPAVSKFIKNKLGRAITTYVGKAAGLSVTEGIPEAATGYLQAIAREKVYKEAGLPIPDREKAAIEGLKMAAKTAPWFALLPGGGGVKVDRPKGTPADIAKEGNLTPESIDDATEKALKDQDVPEAVIDDLVGDVVIDPPIPAPTGPVLGETQPIEEAITEPIQETVPPEPIQPEVLPENVPAEIPTQRTTEEISVGDQPVQPEQDVAVEREENLQSIISPEPQKAATHPVIKELSAAKALGLDKRIEVDQQAEVMPEVEPDAVEEIPQPVQPVQPDLSNITIPDVAIDQEGNQIMEIVDDTPQPLTVQRSAQEAMDDIDSRLAPWKKSKDGISVYDRLLNCLAG